MTRIYEDPRNNLYLSENLTEVQVFASHVSIDGAFECNILNPLCNRETNPRRIINRPQLIYPEYAPKELMEEALKVYPLVTGKRVTNYGHHPAWKKSRKAQHRAG
jgi:hypothetical protein